MARGDATFARCNVDWPMNPRCVALGSAATKWINHVLWLCAVKERRIRLPYSYDTNYIRILSQCDTRTVQKSLAKMQEAGLISIDSENRITVYGVRENNSAIQWLDGDKKPPKLPQTPPKRVTKENENERENENENERERDNHYSALWNETLGDILPKIKSISGARKKKLLMRTKSKEFVESFPEILSKIKASDFLTGKNDKNWRVSFDWIIENDGNWLKIIEGNYDNGTGNKRDTGRTFKSSEGRSGKFANFQKSIETNPL